GPQTVILFGDSLGVPFLGAFAGSVVLSLCAAGVLMFLDIPPPPLRKDAAQGRPIGEIARQPAFLIAVACATSAYALMSFVMTAAPLAMVMHDHSQEAAVL